MQGSGSASSRSGQYLPSYAQCTTNTFLAPSHTHVNHLPASKGMNRVRQSFNPVKSSSINYISELGLVADPVIEAVARLEFEDDLRTGDLLGDS